MEKKELRKKIKALKRQMSIEDITSRSAIIKDKLFLLDDFKRSNDVYIYLNYNQEVQTIDIIKLCQQSGKNVYLPKISGDIMHFVKYRQGDTLIKNSMGISEPANDEYDKKCQGLFLMPLLAFDKDLNRMGYGGGFYDRYLAKHPNNLKIGLAYDFQCVEAVPFEDFDIPLDMVITEKKIYIKDN